MHGGIHLYHSASTLRAVAEIGCGRARDLGDVRVVHGYHSIEIRHLLERFASIEPSLILYPQIEVRWFGRRDHDAVRNLEP